MADDEFEKRLREDLPRGLMRPSASRGRDRGLQARWLTADELLEEGEQVPLAHRRRPDAGRPDAGAARRQSDRLER